MSAHKPKMQIKAFRTNALMDNDFAASAWTTLQTAIRDIFGRKSSTWSYTLLYTHGYNLVLNRHGTMLYDNLKQEIDQQLIKELRPSLRTFTDEISFLRAMKNAWEDYKVAIGMIKDILMYMDRSFVPPQMLKPILQLGYEAFKLHVLEDVEISVLLKTTLHHQVAKDRAGEVVEPSLMSASLKMLVDVQDHSFYIQYFEKQFLEDSLRYYQEKASQALGGSMDCSTYLNLVRDVITKETERTRRFLQLQPNQSANSHDIQTTINNALLSSHVSKILKELGNGMDYLLENDKFDDLSLMYTIIRRVNGFGVMKEVWKSHVESKGKALVTSEEFTKSKDKTFVQPLLELKDKYDAILNQSFYNDKEFRSTVSSAYETIINTGQKSAEFLSLYVDERFRKYAKETNESELEKVLDKIMVMYRFLKDKDLFEKYYKNHLAKRLLNARSSEDAEKMMIAKLKNDAGFQFTSKLESMFRDIKVSETAMESFKEMVRNETAENGSNPLGGTDLVVSVLTTGSWPTQNNLTCRIPQSLQNCVDTYARFYAKSHNGRKLTWQYHMGTAELRAFFSSSKKELTVPTPQMIVLLMFNDQISYTLSDIQAQTSLPLPELKRHLLTLSNAKNPILLLSSNDPNVQAANAVETPEKAVFTFNAKFTHKLVKIKIVLAPAKETADEAQATKNQMDEQRQNEIDAAIVRTMKASRLLDHNNLIAEVTRQLSRRFSPSVQQIKKRIESLIEREYLRRADNSSNYEYLA